jgi:hypothetical protein
MATAEYYRDRRALQKLLGLCYHCGEPCKGALCEKHKKKQRKRGGRRGRKAYHCTLCGADDHNARRCEKAEQEQAA